jgi:hypothetical protein|eukprot:COSAG01_NODE_7514_length_3174_cov_1.355772_2_plen_67_part_00
MDMQGLSQTILRLLRQAATLNTSLDECSFRVVHIPTELANDKCTLRLKLRHMLSVHAQLWLASRVF